MKKKTLAQLRSAIDRVAQLYYTPGCESPLSDDEYENLMGELREMDPADPRLTRVGTPYSDSDMREKRTHSIPMGSLDNTDGSIGGFAKWYDKTLAALGVESADIHVSLKMDGNSVALSYDKGVLTEAISRGNGEVGESLTANAVKWMGVPTCLTAAFTGTIRGEAILCKGEFNKLKENDPTLTNPRNVGSGILGRIDGTQNELIRFFAFNIVDEKIAPSSLNIKFKMLDALGVVPVQYVVFGGTRDQVVASVEAHFAEIEADREHLPFEIDGLVVMIDDAMLQKQITKDRKDELRPKYGRAVKFITQKALTQVVGVTITVGHTGAIIPTAILDPVLVGGVTISNVLLNNWNADSESPSAAHVAVGDIVEVARQGDVIPKIVRVVEKPYDRNTIHEPKVCPVCGAPTTRTLRGKEGVVTLCSSEDCFAQNTGKIKHYIRDAGIMGVGDGVLTALTEEPWHKGDEPLVRTPADLYRLTHDQLILLPIGENRLGGIIRLGGSRATALLAEIEKSKQMPLCNFLGALGVPLLGKRRVEIVCKEQGLRTLGDWMDGGAERIQGDTLRATISEGLQKSKPIVDDLLSVGVVVIPFGAAVLVHGTPIKVETTKSETESPMATRMFEGKSFVFTGTRDLLEETLAAGGEIKSGISAKVDYLVQKDATSSSNKTLKAEALGIKIIGIETLRAILAGERDLP